MILEAVGTRAQMELVHTDKPYPAFVGGYGSGKSTALCFRALYLMMRDHGSYGYTLGYYLPTYDLIRQIGLPKMMEVLGNAGLKFKVNKSEPSINIHGFGRVLFRTLDNPERIVGYETAHSFIDELDTLPTDKAEDCWNRIIARNRSIIIDEARNTVASGSTPEGFRFLHAKWGDIKEPSDLVLIRASTYDNARNLPIDYIRSLEDQYSGPLLDAYLMGRFVNLQQASVYYEFDRGKHNKPGIIQPGEHLFIGQDFNVGACCSTIFAIRAGVPQLLEEVASHDTESVAVGLSARGNPVTIYPDASGASRSTNASQSDIDILRQAGFIIDAPKQNGRVQDRVNAVNRLFARGELFIDVERCPKVTAALEQQAYDKRTGAPQKYGEPGSIDDWMDSFGYFIARRFPIERPAYKPIKTRWN